MTCVTDVRGVTIYGLKEEEDMVYFGLVTGLRAMTNGHL